MKQTFTASVVREGDWFVAQCLEVDIASQGESLDDAVANLKEALELHFKPPTATVPKHREVATGTLRSVLRYAGLNEEEFERL